MQITKKSVNNSNVLNGLLLISKSVLGKWSNKVVELLKKKKKEKAHYMCQNAFFSSVQGAEMALIRNKFFSYDFKSIGDNHCRVMSIDTPGLETIRSSLSPARRNSQLIAYSEWCQIRDLRRREFCFGTKDTASVTQSFMRQKFY